MLTVVGLDPDQYRNRYPRQLSGGQQQRVGVARALAADPPIMLMDEPFGAVDPITRSRLQDEFLSLQQTLRKTIVFVTHDFDEALKLGDRIAVLREGSAIAQYDTPEQILATPADDFVESFIGEGAALKRLHFERVDSLHLGSEPDARPSTGRRRRVLDPARRARPDGRQGTAVDHRRQATAARSVRSQIDDILARVHPPTAPTGGGLMSDTVTEPTVAVDAAEAGDRRRLHGRPSRDSRCCLAARPGHPGDGGAHPASRSTSTCSGQAARQHRGEHPQPRRADRARPTEHVRLSVTDRAAWWCSSRCRSGILVTRPATRRLAPLVLGVANLGQAAPSLGLLALFGFYFIGFWAVALILTAYAALSVLRNTIVGLQAGRQRGCSTPPAAWACRRPPSCSGSSCPPPYPSSAPGVRTALVLAVGTVPLGYALDAGGLGLPLFSAIKTDRQLVILTIAMMIACLALPARLARRRAAAGGDATRHPMTLPTSHLSRPHESTPKKGTHP